MQKLNVRNLNILNYYRIIISIVVNFTFKLYINILYSFLFELQKHFNAVYHHKEERNSPQIERKQLCYNEII